MRAGCSAPMMAPMTELTPYDRVTLESVAAALQEGLVQELAASNMYAETLQHALHGDAGGNGEVDDLVEALLTQTKSALAHGYALRDALAAGRLPT